jgi:hypothetical protein
MRVMEGKVEMFTWLPYLKHRGIRLACWALLIVLSLVLTQTIMKRTTMLVQERVKLQRYLEGTAHRPFIYRVLVPGIIHLLTATIPDSVVRPSADRVMGHLLPQSMDDSADRVAHLYLEGILILSLIGYALVAGLLYVAGSPVSEHLFTGNLVTVHWKSSVGASFHAGSKIDCG